MMKNKPILGTLLLLSFLASCGGAPQSGSSSLAPVPGISTSGEASSNSSGATPSSSSTNTSISLSSDDPTPSGVSFVPDANPIPETEQKAHVKTMQDSAILHAWNWNCGNIESRLDEIKEAGFSAIQLSPMQPQKDYGGGQIKNEWWKLYQPLGFKVADGTHKSVIGTKSQLTSLATKAKAKGLKIIMDIVANHLANNGDGDKHWVLQGAVKNVEPQIYDNTSKYLHPNCGTTDDGSVQRTVWGNMGMPDLNTGDPYVQSRIYGLLKEYIDCGVSGFRFDAAKHIETEEDGDYASDFWPNLISEIEPYSEQKLGEKAYIYGEILNTPGSGRNWNAYTKRMSLVDNRQGEQVLTGVANGNPDNCRSGYNIGNPNKAVLWAESHDTFAGDYGFHSNTYSSENCNKAYAVQTSRKDAAILYFSRPTSMDGQIGSVGNDDYKSPEIAGANKFHNEFIGANESLSANSGVFINVRKDGQKAGAMLVSTGNQPSALTLDLPDGTYVDFCSNKNYTVKNGSVSNLNFVNGIIALTNGKSGETPSGEKVSSINLSASDSIFKVSTNVSIQVGAGASATYEINGVSQGSLRVGGTTTFSVGEGLGEGDITIKASVTSSTGYVTTKTIVVTKSSLSDMRLVVKGVPEGINLYVWCWPSGGDGHWYPMASQGKNRVLASLPYDNYLIALFDADNVPTNLDEWKLPKSKSSDRTLQVGQNLIEYSSLNF